MISRLCASLTRQRCRRSLLLMSQTLLAVYLILQLEPASRSLAISSIITSGISGASAFQAQPRPSLRSSPSHQGLPKIQPRKALAGVAIGLEQQHFTLQRQGRARLT